MSNYKNEEVMSFYTTDTTVNITTVPLVGSNTNFNLLHNMCHTFQLPAEEVANIINNSIIQSTLTVDRLTTIFISILPVVEKVGLSLPETLNILRVLSDCGLGVDSIEKGLGRVLNNMGTPTEKVKTELSKLNISVDSISPLVVGFQQAIKNLFPILLDVKTGTVDTGKVTKLFGVRGQVILTILIGNFFNGDFNQIL